MRKILETPKASSRVRPNTALDHQRYSFNSTKQETNLKLLTTIRSRNPTSPIEPQINSNIASKVVRDYILPLFHQDYRDKSLEKRRKSLGLKHKKQNFSTFDGTLYTELKLSDQLSLDLKTLNAELEHSKKSLHETEQKVFVIELELNSYKQQSFIDQANIQSLMYQNEELQKAKMIKESPYLNLYEQLLVYKSMIVQLSKEKEKLSKDLQDERALNDIRLKVNFFFNSCK